MTKARAAPKPGKTGDVEAAKKLLEDAISGKVPRARKPTKTDGIKELKPLIAELRAKDYSWAEIATLLKDTGFGNKDTIRYAISEVKPRRQRGTGAGHPDRDAEKQGNGKSGSAEDPATAQPDGPADTKAAVEAKHGEEQHAAQRRASWTP